MLSRLKSKYPDKSFEDDEAVFGQISDDYDDLDGQLAERDARLKEYEGREKELADMFTGDPRKAQLMMDFRDGKDPLISMIKRFGPELETILHDEARQDEIAQANKEYTERVMEEKNYEEQYNKNLESSIANIESLKEKGMSDEDIDAAFALLVGIVRDGIVGKFSPESFEMAVKAINHDTDVENAGSDGEVRGRNAKIDEKLRKSKGDGTGPIGGQNGGATQKPPRQNLGALDRFDDGTMNIFERGGEKRIKY